MNETEFRAYAKTEGYDEPELRTQPPGKFFDTHAHERHLIVLIQEGQFTVDYGKKTDVFGPGDMCYVEPGVKHTDAAGPDGANYFLAWR
ncbi:MAG: cupin domain-containing protein [Alphaproteobacteria bacterium]|jgi:quercetin dioxygenase-like cupin family protein